MSEKGLFQHNLPESDSHFCFDEHSVARPSTLEERATPRQILVDQHAERAERPYLHEVESQ
jgi:hypothetical protein